MSEIEIICECEKPYLRLTLTYEEADHIAAALSQRGLELTDDSDEGMLNWCLFSALNSVLDDDGVEELDEDGVPYVADNHNGLGAD